MADLDAVYRAVDENEARFAADLRRAVRQPSISSQGIGVRECASLLATMMRDIGIDARVMETAGHPVVYGEIRAPRPDARHLQPLRCTAARTARRVDPPTVRGHDRGWRDVWPRNDRREG